MQAAVVLWRSLRPPFLLLTLAMLLLAYASTAYFAHIERADLLFWLFFSAISAAAASNLLNEYFDFVSGVDLRTQPTPFSGGSHALVEFPQYQEWVKWAGLLLVSLSVWSGLYLAAQTTWWVLPLGALGVALLITYSLLINRLPWLCLFAPGLGYGLVMFVGASWVLAAGVEWSLLWLLPVPTLLVSALLLLNQFPDVDADAAAGRNHAVIAWGRRQAYWVFVALHLLSYAWLLWLAWWFGQPAWLWAWLWLPLTVWMLRLAYRHVLAEVSITAMALNTLLVLMLPATLAVVQWWLLPTA